MKTLGYNKKNRWKIEYLNLLSTIRRVPHSIDIPVQVFVKLPSLEDIDHDEEISGDNDADLKIEDESARKGFN